MAVRIPGCTDCHNKTAAGGRSVGIVTAGEPRYQVVARDGQLLGEPFASVVAAATFMRGHPGSTVHDLHR